MCPKQMLSSFFFTIFAPKEISVFLCVGVCVCVCVKSSNMEFHLKPTGTQSMRLKRKIKRNGKQIQFKFHYDMTSVFSVLLFGMAFRDGVGECVCVTKLKQIQNKSIPNENRLKEENK